MTERERHLLRSNVRLAELLKETERELARAKRDAATRASAKAKPNARGHNVLTEAQKQRAVLLREFGWSYGRLARLFGVSQQAMWELVKRREAT